MCIEFTDQCYTGFKDHGPGDLCIPESDSCAVGYKDDGRGT